MPWFVTTLILVFLYVAFAAFFAGLALRLATRFLPEPNQFGRDFDSGNFREAHLDVIIAIFWPLVLGVCATAVLFSVVIVPAVFLYRGIVNVVSGENL